MKRKKYILYIEDVIEAIDKIERYIKGLNFDTFTRNELVMDAVLRNLEIIGEASRKIQENKKKIYRYTMEENDWVKEYCHS